MYAEYGRCGSAAKFGFIMVQAPLTLDASVILDMHSVNSLDRLLAVDREFLTTDFVFNTIRNSISHSSFAKLEKSQKLKIQSMNKNIEFFFEFCSPLRKALSIEGCSVLFLAKNLNATLLSSDWNLLSVAKENGVRSFNLLDVLECMVKRNLLSRTEAVDNLTTLMDGNRTLRKEECEKKIVRWKN